MRKKNTIGTLLSSFLATREIETRCQSDNKINSEVRQSFEDDKKTKIDRVEMAKIRASLSIGFYAIGGLILLPNPIS